MRHWKGHNHYIHQHCDLPLHFICSISEPLSESPLVQYFFPVYIDLSLPTQQVKDRSTYSLSITRQGFLFCLFLFVCFLIIFGQLRWKVPWSQSSLHLNFLSEWSFQRGISEVKLKEPHNHYVDNSTVSLLYKTARFNSSVSSFCLNHLPHLRINLQYSAFSVLMQNSLDL